MLLRRGSTGAGTFSVTFLVQEESVASNNIGQPCMPSVCDIQYSQQLFMVGVPSPRSAVQYWSMAYWEPVRKSGRCAHETIPFPSSHTAAIAASLWTWKGWGRWIMVPSYKQLLEIQWFMKQNSSLSNTLQLERQFTELIRVTFFYYYMIEGSL